MRGASHTLSLSSVSCSTKCCPLIQHFVSPYRRDGLRLEPGPSCKNDTPPAALLLPCNWLLAMLKLCSKNTFFFCETHRILQEAVLLWVRSLRHAEHFQALASFLPQVRLSFLYLTPVWKSFYISARPYYVWKSASTALIYMFWRSVFSHHPKESQQRRPPHSVCVNLSSICDQASA